MNDKKKNEELQSRREFFKKAAKVTLPVIGAIVLACNPVLAKVEESAADCKYSCSGSCSGSCKGTCSSTCTGTCSGSCKTYCQYTCKGTCSGSCRESCSSSSKR